MKRESKRFGGSSGVRVIATRNGQGWERTYPVHLFGVTAVPVSTTIQDARRLHRRLGEALNYLIKEAK